MIRKSSRPQLIRAQRLGAQAQVQAHGSGALLRRGRGSVASWCIWQCGWVPAIFFCLSPYVYACVHVQVAGRSSSKFRGSDALECSWLPCMFYGRMQIIVVVKGVYASAILGQEH